MKKYLMTRKTNKKVQDTWYIMEIGVIVKVPYTARSIVQARSTMYYSLKRRRYIQDKWYG